MNGTAPDHTPGSAPGTFDNSPDAPGESPDTAPGTTYAEAGGRFVGVAEAATILGVHPRTVERRLETGRLRSRKQNGTREIWIPHDAPDSAPGVEDERPAVSGSTPGAAGQGAETALVAYQRLAGPSVAMARELADVCEARVADAQAEARRARWGGRLGWSAAIVASLVAGFLGAVWSAQRQQRDGLRDRLGDTQAQLAEAQQQAQVAIQAATGDAAEERQQLTQALQSAQADLQEAILDAQEAAQRPIADRWTDSPAKFNLGDSEAVGGVWKLGTVDPFGQLDSGIFAAGLAPEGQGEH